MFELPAVLAQDYEKDASLPNTRAFFRSLETEEIERILSGRHLHPNTPEFVERVKRKSHLKGQTEIDEYIGMVSQGVFDAQGLLIGDTFSEAQAILGGARVHAKLLPEVKRASDEGDTTLANLQCNETVDSSLHDRHDEAEDPEEFRNVPYDDIVQLASTRTMSTVGKQIVTYRAGLELLPRNTCAPQVLMDDVVTQKIVHGSQTINPWNISPEAKQILLRSNYRAPLGLSFCLHDDQWAHHNYMRRRSLQVVTNLLYICLERRDYERAWSALNCLLREPYVDVRLVWMPALQLLAWRHSERPTAKTPEDFLDWLIANFPHLPQIRSHVHRPRPKAKLFMPVSIMVKLANGKFSEALNKAEQAINSAQYNSDPTCWALRGVAHMKANKSDSSQEALKSFKKCLDLGGVLPARLQKLARNFPVANEGLRKVLESWPDVDSGISDSSSESNADPDLDSDSDTVLKEEVKLVHERASNPSFESSPNSEIDSGEPQRDIDNQEPNERHAKRPRSHEETKPSSELGSEPCSGVKQPRLDVGELASISNQGISELPSSQPFFSQALTLGAEMGSSDSDDDI